MLALKSAVKPMSGTKLLALITMLRVMKVPVITMIVLSLVSTYNNKLTFQMQSRNILYDMVLQIHVEIIENIECIDRVESTDSCRNYRIYRNYRQSQSTRVYFFNLFSVFLLSNIVS